VRSGDARRTSRLLRALDPLGERLAIVPSAPPVPMSDLFSRFWPYARPHRRRLMVVLLLVAVAPAVQAVEIGLYQRLVDDVLVPRDLRPFAWIALAYVGLNLLGRGTRVRRRRGVHRPHPALPHGPPGRPVLPAAPAAARLPRPSASATSCPA
jgi:hypothetical protein